MLPEDLGTKLGCHAVDIPVLVFTGIATQLIGSHFSGGSQSLLDSALVTGLRQPV